MPEVKVLFIDNYEFDADLLKGIEECNEEESGYSFAITVTEYTPQTDKKDLKKEIKASIDKGLKEGVEILLFDLGLTREEENSTLEESTRDDFLSISLADEYDENENVMIVFTSLIPGLSTVSEYEYFCSQNPDFFKKGWHYLHKPYVNRSDESYVKRQVIPCPKTCLNAKTYNIENPCISIECTYWRLVKLFKEFNKRKDE